MRIIKFVHNIREKVPPIFYVLVLFSIAISLGAYFNYRNEVRNIVVQKKNELSAITNLKAKQIDSWRLERIHDAQLIKENLFLIEPLHKLSCSNESAIIKSEIKHWLKPMVINNNYKDIVVIDSAQNFLMTVSGLPFNLSKIDSESINTSKKLNDIFLTDLYLNTSNLIKIDLVIPISTKKDNNNPFVYIILKIDPFTDLYPIIESWPTPSKTSETLIVEKSIGEDSVLFLSNLKFKKNSALKRKTSIKDTILPAVKAVLGREGVYEAVDYKGEKVLAESKKIPNTPWFMISKTDINELYEPLYQKTKWFALFIILIVFLTITFSWQIWTNQKNRNLKNLFDSQSETKIAENKFQHFFKNTSAGISITELDGKLTVNDAFAEMTGYSKSELSNLNWQVFTHPDDIELSSNLANSMLEGKIEKATFEKRYIHKNGSVIWTLVNTSLQKDKNGSPLNFLTNVLDITDKKQAEDILKENEKWLKESQRVGKIGSYKFDIESNYWTCSDVLDEIFGINNDLKKTLESWNELIHPIHKSLMLKYFSEEVIGKKLSFDKEYQIIRKNDGQIRWVHGRGELSFNENGIPINMIGTILDITVQKTIEEALKKSEERYRGLFDNIEAGIVVHAPDTSILMSNSKASELLGLSSEQLNGKLAIDPLWKFLSTNNEPLPYEEYPVNKVASTKKPINNLVFGVFRPITNDTVWLIINGFPVFNDKGEISEILISFIDITERQKSSNKVLNLNNELELKNEELEQLIYVASHDLRSPLVNIQGFNSELKQSLKIITDLIAKEEDIETTKENIIRYLNSDFKESVEFIEISAEKISKLISGLLKVSRLSRTITTFSEVNINNLISNILSTFEFKIKTEEIHIEVGDLPNCFGDELMLDQLFSNLIGNAIKFARPKQLPKIKISGTIANEQIIFCIEDNGIGFSTEYLDKIFLLFHRLDNKTEGEGLGLAIVKKIIDKHNGNVWAESTPNKGSKFYISIPNKKINL